MELEIYNAFRGLGFDEAKAQAIVESINKTIDQRYAIHSQQLATQGDVEKVRFEIEKIRLETKAEIEKAKAEIIKWMIATMFGGIGAAMAIGKLFLA
jgi:hypothetical protein